ncbi:MAG: glycosyltransferase family 4 protein, partial [Ginsengibacter sp.]
QLQYHCEASLFRVLHKGIENKLITFNRKDFLNQKIPGSILFVKTDFVLGGLYALIEALKNIDRKIILTIVGPAKEHHEMLENLLVKAHIPFELFDYVQPVELLKKMQQSQIFCVPSKREAFGLANLEAMAMGCKIVTTNVGGIPEALNGDRFAWLVKDDDPVSLRNALNEALDTSIEKDLNDITDHLNHFSSTKVISRFKEILEECF